MTRCYYHGPERKFMVALQALQIAQSKHRQNLHRYEETGREGAIEDAIRESAKSVNDADRLARDALKHANENCVPLHINNSRGVPRACRLVAITPSGFVLIREGSATYRYFARDRRGRLASLLRDIPYGGDVIDESRSVPFNVSIPGRGVQFPAHTLWGGDPKLTPREYARTRGWI